MRLLVTGSRDWEGRYAEARINQVLNTVLALSDILGDKLTVVHGACPTGADQITDAWAVRREHDGVAVERYPANWQRYGKGAGPRRNEELVRLGADMCIGFLRQDNSTGTKNCLALSRHAGIPTFVVNWED
jgi:SLOG family YspA-like protein